MKYLIVIPARLNSTRLPNKPLLEISGKSMIQRTYERCLLATQNKNIVVATDSTIIFNHIIELGYNAIMTSSNCLTGTDRVAEVALKIDADYYINVQGDEPIINPEDIIKAISAIEIYPHEVLNGYSIIKSREDYTSLTIPKVVFNKDKKLLYMSRSPIPGNKKGDFEKSWKQVCIYVYPKETLQDFSKCKTKTQLENMEDIEILRFLELGINVRMIEMSSDSIAIDVPSDIERLLKVLGCE